MEEPTYPMDHTGLTLRFRLSDMTGTAGTAKGARTAVCLGRTTKGWLFVPTTSSWKAGWQTPITQTGNGWSGWDLRYRRPVHWTPNMAMHLTDEEVSAALQSEGQRAGHAPMAVVRHGLAELDAAQLLGLMTVEAWFAQETLSQA